MFIDNTKYGNPLKLFISILRGNIALPETHISAVRPGPQEKHSKHEVIVFQESVNSGSEGVRDYIFTIEVYNLTSKEDHLNYLYELIDTIDNLPVSGNIASVSTTGGIVSTLAESGERAHIADVEVICSVFPKNFNNVQ